MGEILLLGWVEPPPHPPYRAPSPPKEEKGLINAWDDSKHIVHSRDFGETSQFGRHEEVLSNIKSATIAIGGTTVGRSDGQLVVAAFGFLRISD